ncbi:MAG: hypothetical protein ABJD97_05190 [Betaproteobacteria bacterium]
MLKTKRRRAVVLALIAFFCTAAATYVAVDWKRFGGGILAFFKGSHDEHLAALGTGAIGTGGTHSSDVPTAPKPAGLPQVAALHPHGAKHIGGGGRGKAIDDLFVYGDPAAGIPAGSFLVAQNETPALGDVGGGAPAAGGAPAPEGGGAPAAGGDGGSGGGGSSSSSGGGTGGDNGFPIGTPTPAPAPTPGSPPAAPSPPPAPAPSQDGSTDGPPPPPAPTSAIPEASNVAMMSLGALFLAVAAQRRRSSNKAR